MAANKYSERLFGVEAWSIIATLLCVLVHLVTGWLPVAIAGYVFYVAVASAACVMTLRGNRIDNHFGQLMFVTMCVVLLYLSREMTGLAALGSCMVWVGAVCYCSVHLLKSAVPGSLFSACLSLALLLMVAFGLPYMVAKFSDDWMVVALLTGSPVGLALFSRLFLASDEATVWKLSEQH